MRYLPISYVKFPSIINSFFVETGVGLVPAPVFFSYLLQIINEF